MSRAALPALRVVALAACAALGACDGGEGTAPQTQTAEITQIVLLFKTPKNLKATRTKEEARTVATSLRADLLAGRPIADLLKFTDFVDRNHKPYNGGRFRVARDSTAAPALRDAIFATPVGGIGAGPIEIEVGFVVFRREE